MLCFNARKFTEFLQDTRRALWYLNRSSSSFPIKKLKIFSCNLKSFTTLRWKLMQMPFALNDYSCLYYIQCRVGLNFILTDYAPVISFSCWTMRLQSTTCCRKSDGFYWKTRHHTNNTCAKLACKCIIFKACNYFHFSQTTLSTFYLYCNHLTRLHCTILLLKNKTSSSLKNSFFKQPILSGTLYCISFKKSLKILVTCITKWGMENKSALQSCSLTRDYLNYFFLFLLLLACMYIIFPLYDPFYFFLNCRFFRQFQSYLWTLKNCEIDISS